MLDEFYFCIKELGFSYSDLLKIPVFERKYFINKYVDDIQRINDARNGR